MKRYILPLWKWWWMLAACILVATASSFVATRQQPPIYSTRATVMVGSAIENPNPSGNELYLTQQLANTYVDVVQRDTVRARTMEALGLKVLPEYRARVVAGTQLIELTVTDTNPQRAKAVVDELVKQLMLLGPQNPEREDAKRQAFIAAQLNDLEAKIQETQEEIAKKQSDLANLFSARQIADTQTQIEGLQEKLSTLQANYATLLSQTQSGAVNSITLIEPATLPAVPVGPQKMYTILMAAAIGFVLAAAAAYLLEYLDDTVKNPDEVQNTLGLATLGAVPQAESVLVGDRRDLLVLRDGRSTVTEAYRVLRTNLAFVSVKDPVQSLVVTSPAPHDGKSITAANLAAALAQAGKRVILVDTDLHRPRLHKLFEVRNTAGVTTALLEEELEVESVLQRTKLPGLQILPSGPLPPNPAELLDSGRMRDIVTQLKTLADVVVFDSPPIVALADAAILSTQCDGVLMVLNAGRTRRNEARRALEALRHVGARLLGVVLNQMPMEGHGYYYYYHYGYGYHSSYGHEAGKDKTESVTFRLRRRLTRIPRFIPRLGNWSARRGGPAGVPRTGQESGTGRKADVNLP